MAEVTVWKRLAPRGRWLFYAQAVSQVVFVWVPLTFVGFIGLPYLVSWTTAFGLISALWVLILLGLVWFPWLAFDRWAYAVRDADLLIARGVLVREVTAIPLARVQHVDTQQGPIEQLFSLSSLQVHTASGVGGDGVIPSLEPEDAEFLRDQLLAARGDGGV